MDTPLSERFAFGKNWATFLEGISDGKIQQAMESLMSEFGQDLTGKSFLDIGCGSGLFSLAARKLGARVISLDFDPDSVHCAQRLKATFFPDDNLWSIYQGSVLDQSFITSLGTFDIVYSWGVLHHTGQLWLAMDIAASAVAAGGMFFISIYNDQDGYSKRWRRVKRLYVTSPKPCKLMLVVAVLVFLQAKSTITQMLRLKSPLAYWKSLRPTTRGMSYWTDLVDWVGGYPFEVAKPEAVFDFCYRRGFDLIRLKTCGGGAACNEFVFIRKRRVETTPARVY